MLTSCEDVSNVPASDIVRAHCYKTTTSRRSNATARITMNKILFYNAAGFIIGAVVFANVFSHRTKWERGIFLTFLVNIPNLIFLLFVIGPNYGSGRDLYSLLVVVGL